MAVMTLPEQGIWEWVDFGYTRLSNDPEGRRGDHETQVDSILRTRAGLPDQVGEIRWFKDDDRSASKAKVVREDWDKLLAAIAALDPTRQRPRVIGWATSRFTRRGSTAAADFADLLHSKAGELWAGGVPIAVAPGDRQALLFTATSDQTYSEAVTKGTRDGMRKKASKGRPHGELGYGWEPVRVAGTTKVEHVGDVIVPEQQDVVLQAARWVIAGDSLRSICNRFNDPQGEHHTPAPGVVSGRYPQSLWEPQKLRQLLLRPSNIGIRVHRQGHNGVVTETRGTWEPLLDEDTFRAVRDRLTSKDERTVTGTDGRAHRVVRRRDTSSVPRHLLSMIATCEVCGDLVSSTYSRGGTPAQRRRAQEAGQPVPGYWVYRCRSAHVMKSEVRTDTVVEAALFRRIDSGELREVILARRSAEQHGSLAQVHKQIADAERKRDEAGRLFATNVIDAATLGVIVAECRSLIEDGQAKLAARSPHTTAAWEALAMAQNAEDVWAAMPVDRRRTVVAALFSITLAKTNARGRSAFSAESVKVTDLPVV